MKKPASKPFRVATRGTGREINRQIALTLIRTHQPISRADLARRMGTRRGAVSLLVNELIEEGMVYEGATGEASRGRKPTFLYMDSRGRCAVAVDIRATRSYVMITDLVGRQLMEIGSFATDRDPKRFLKDLSGRVKRLLAEHKDLGDCAGIGVVVPGMVDRDGENVLHAPALGWRDLPLRRPLAAATGLPVVIENSGKACALSLMWSARGDANPPADLVFVSVSDGVGVGVTVRGEILRGRHNTAGEFGHVPLSVDGPPCACGARGCWEAYVSNLATLGRYFGRPLVPGRPIPEEAAVMTVEDLILRARGGDGKALAAIQSTARYLGLGLASIVNALDPDRIYVGGEITTAWDLLEPTVRAALAERALLASNGDTDIAIVKAEDSAPARGRRAHRRARVRGIGRGVRTAAAVLLAWGAAAACGAEPVAVLRDDMRAFLERELASHLSEIATLDPPPDRVHGALTTGEFSWGTFQRALAAWAEASGQKTLAGRDLAQTAGRLGLVEEARGGNSFAQLYGALSLRHFGRDLETNALWRSLDEPQRTAWKRLLDSTRFYDPATRTLKNKPENYLGVAARIASLSHDMGLGPDRAALDSLLDRAAEPFARGRLYADDAPPHGRYDRYSNEYARYVYEAAGLAGRRDIQDLLRPSLRAQMRLYWDLVAPDGYAYTWGRSLGVVGYLDSVELAAFLANEPDLRPAPLADLAAAFAAAWRWLRHDYRDDAHLLSVFAFGRGSYGYITREREWQQTAGFLGKLTAAQAKLFAALAREGVTEIPDRVPMAPVARYVSFANGDRPAGVWVVRQGAMRFAVPFTSGPRPGLADYLPAPHGLPGFAAPVELASPALTTFLELEGGRTLTTADGADAIEPDADGLGVTARWHRLALVGGREGQREDVGVTSTVTWRLEGGRLHRRETIAAERPITLRRVRIAVPVTGARCETAGEADRFAGADGVLRVVASFSEEHMRASLQASGDGPAGRGARGGIPFHRVYEAEDVRVAPDRSFRSDIQLEVEPQEAP